MLELASSLLGCFQTKNYLKINLFSFLLINHVFLYSDKGTLFTFLYTVISCVILKDEANGRRKDEFSLTKYPRNGLIVQGHYYIFSQTEISLRSHNNCAIIISRQKCLLCHVQILTLIFSEILN